MKKLFLIIGAPGSGKTTDAEIIAKDNDNITHYSTGDLLRAEVVTGSTIGKELDKYISNGNLVPIDVVIKIIIKAINNSKDDNVIIDGYPRSGEQMHTLDEYITKENNINLVSVVEVEVSEEVAKDRVLGRARGADDSEEVFNNRMKIYTQPLQEIQEFYKNKGILKKINAERSIQEIVADIQKVVKELMQ